MKRKKIALLLLVALTSLIFFASFDDLPYGNPENQRYYEQNSPLTHRLLVQQLKEPTKAGENMRFIVAYEPGMVRSASIDVYLSKEGKVTLYDDGRSGGDTRAGDNLFSGFIREDIQVFKEKVKSKEAIMDRKGFFLHFDGHLGQMVNAKEAERFNFAAFDAFEEAPLPMGIIDIADCDTEIKKENSLFITDLDVVEDPARTYNLCTGQGNPFGVWTFGNLMKNMAYQSVTSISAKAFIKNWLGNWTQNRFINSQRILNSHTGTTIPVATRLRENEMVDQVIRPWLRNAQNNQTLSVTLATWSGLWDGTHQDSILKYAPFKLTAIVNRIDLRGNRGYVTSLTNAGETRFIFSVIQTAPGFNCGIPLDNAGREGFNVIFEYGNPQTSCEALQAYAHQWLNLSDETLGSSAFNDSLEIITRQVIDSGNGGASKPNQNCLNQLRTNEIALSNGSIFDFDEGGGNQNILPTNRWQLLQFEIDATTKLLKGTPPSLNTRIHANGGDEQVSNMADRNYSDAILSNDFNYVDSLGKWVNQKQNQVKRGRINYPVDFPNSTRKVLSATSEVISNAPNGSDHFWDGINFAFGYDVFGLGLTAFPSILVDTNKARFQASLNTCGGCHSAESQTIFAHVRYVGLGISAKYWADFPGDQPDFTQIGSFKIEHVSPFLTGRKLRNSSGKFSGFGDGPFGSTFTDENFDPGADPDDESFEGLFFVDDAKGRIDGSNADQWGLNDLERRKIDLCNFLNSSCDPFIHHQVKSSIALVLGGLVSFSPFPLGSH